jgi:hypothetical protein
MWLVAWARLGAALALTGVAACIPEQGVGYVEIKAFPSFSVPLYINTTKLDALKDGTAVLRQPVGKASLRLERGGQMVPLCEFDVRKNRITTVTVSAGRDLRCRVQN